MGKKKDNEAAEKAPPPAEKNEGKDDEEEEDTPTIKLLKEIDDKYCAAQVELEREIEKKRKEFSERQAPLLAERLQVLSEASGCSTEDATLGTPACKDFWLTALQNCSDLSQTVEKWDEPILSYLHDIKKTDLDVDVPNKGFRLDFIFKENPYFSNESLWSEFHTDYDPATYKPYKDEELIDYKTSSIEWKPGKNVTIEKVKQDSGGKKGKRKPAKSKEQPRQSFFRIWFTSIKQGEPLDSDLKKAMGAEDDEDMDEDEDEMVADLLDNIFDLGRMLGEQFVPYAVRYYTGEACDDDDDDDDEDEEEEEEDDDDDDDDESEDEPPKKPAGKAKPGKKAAGGAAQGQKQEECKQQ